MKRTARAIKKLHDGSYDLFQYPPITCRSTGEMADGTKVWTSEDIPGCWFSLHHHRTTWFFILEGVN